MGWVSKLIVLCVVGYGGFEAYTLHRGGYFDLPDLPEGAYTASFKSGLRGIVLDAEVKVNTYADSHKLLRRLSSANPDRKYLGVPFEVAAWFEDIWSTCIKPTPDIQEYIDKNLPNEVKIKMQGARLDAFCYIDVDGDQRIARGLIYSVPQL